MNYDLKFIGNKIAGRRSALGMKQYELADRLNISSTHMSNIENGNKAPSFELMLEICNVLKTETECLTSNKVYADIDEEVIDKYKKCTDEDKIKISQIIDVFLNSQYIQR